MSSDTLILDNGGYSIKAGLANSDSARTFPNCVSKARSERRRLFVSDQLDECKDCSGLFMLLPLSKGILSNYDTQRQIWDHVLRNRLELRLDRSDRPLNVVITQPHFNFKQSQNNLYELWFEEYAVDRLFTATPTCFASLNHVPDQSSLTSFTGVIVDSGFSFTHVVPYVNGTKVKRKQSISFICIFKKLTFLFISMIWFHVNCVCRWHRSHRSWWQSDDESSERPDIVPSAACARRNSRHESMQRRLLFCFARFEQ